MFVLEGKVVIGNYTFRTLVDLEYTKSVDTLTDTAVIKLPTSFKIKQNNVLKFTEEVIQVGDKVAITVGYEGKYSGTEFIGFVKKVKPTIPIEIHCEDTSWLLRRKNIRKSWQGKVMLKEILQEVVKNSGIPERNIPNVKLADNIPKMPIDEFIIPNKNGTQVLQTLKKEFCLTAFINDNNELYCGLQQLTNIGEKAVYDLNYNLVKNNLEFRAKEERKIKIRYQYIAPNGKRKIIEVGDEDGELRTYHTSVISDEKKLKEMAVAEIEQLKYDGFDGNVVSFLIPYATRGMKAVVKDKNYKNKEKEGNYFIKKVVTNFGTDGARRTVTIGRRL